MTHLSKLLFGFLAIGLAVASPVEVVIPSADEVSTADFLGDILNLLKVGLVTNITAEITVSMLFILVFGLSVFLLLLLTG